MAIFGRQYLEEVYKSKYAEFLDDEDDEDQDDDDEKEDSDDEKSSGKDKKDKSSSSNVEKKSEHLDKHELLRISNILKLGLDKFPKLKKCCDFNDLSDRDIDSYNDEGERESSFDKYYRSDPKAFIELINGDVLSGYPDLRSNGSDEYDKDRKAYIKFINDEFETKKIKAKFVAGQNKDDEVISFGVKSTKEK